ncbi:hypothetical protein M758_UG335000 [Ceratodon purpureus]|nr:hypothetical protein M758_UG335000 [Ceratodon purpureus]
MLDSLVEVDLPHFLNAAVYFVYDLSPIVVTITEHKRNFGHFITRLCAVLGGTFALTGMLDKWMFRIIEVMTSSAKGTLL